MFNASSDAIHLFGVTIHWYGALIALGMTLAIALCALREKRYGLPKDTVLDLALLCIPIAIICARIYFVAFSWQLYADDPVSALYIWEGGLAIYGGIIGGFLSGAVYARRKGLSFLHLADLAAPTVALAQGIGRWGNFFNQEAYGAAARHAWQQAFPISVYIQADGLWHYATFFYESLWCLAIAAALLLAERRRMPRRHGDQFFAYLFLYALERFLVEGLRTDSLYLGGIRVSQALSLAVIVFYAFIRLRRSPLKPFAAGILAAAAAMAALAFTGHLALALVPAALALALAVGDWVCDARAVRN